MSGRLNEWMVGERMMTGRMDGWVKSGWMDNRRMTESFQLLLRAGISHYFFFYFPPQKAEREIPVSASAPFDGS